MSVDESSLVPPPLVSDVPTHNLSPPPLPSTPSSSFIEPSATQLPSSSFPPPHSLPHLLISRCSPAAVIRHRSFLWHGFTVCSLVDGTSAVQFPAAIRRLLYPVPYHRQSAFSRSQSVPQCPTSLCFNPTCLSNHGFTWVHH